MRRTPRSTWPIALSILVAGAMVSGSLLWAGQQVVAKLDQPPVAAATDSINGTPGTIVGSQLISGAAAYAEFRGAVDDALASP